MGIFDPSNNHRAIVLLNLRNREQNSIQGVLAYAFLIENIARTTACGVLSIIIYEYVHVRITLCQFSFTETTINSGG